MGELPWPSKAELDGLRKMVAEMAGKGTEKVRVVVSPYRICPLGAHIDHQGGTVSAMTINRGILLGFVPSGDSQVLLCSGQFKGEVRRNPDMVILHSSSLSIFLPYYALFLKSNHLVTLSINSVDEIKHPKHFVKENDKINGSGSSKQQEECNWGNYARGAIYALQSRGNHLTQTTKQVSVAAIIKESLLIKEKLMEQNIALQRSKELAMNANEAMCSFWAVMSREMIRPSQSIAAIMSVLQIENWVSEEQRKIVDAMAKMGLLLSGWIEVESGIIGFVCGSEDLDSSGLSSSAAVGIAYLLAFESANNLAMSPAENIEYDRLNSRLEDIEMGLSRGAACAGSRGRTCSYFSSQNWAWEGWPHVQGLQPHVWLWAKAYLFEILQVLDVFFTSKFLANCIHLLISRTWLIENEYLGLKNGILDQSAILLSSYGCLTCMNCKSNSGVMAGAVLMLMLRIVCVII
ncbi:hypothetical protein TEA_002085 [Camellia sinensis var. sinensis]|uniref:Uncharacterized protein n=1 Tax=Camellia sinensis var. sinensis TaxID=542762 RepID=A0A4S4D1B0_CAMSN|nr:hypothetical protein TEA_002085 [Camellia sinensis var. sinensis]